MAKTVKKLRALFDKWVERLGLRWWKIDVVYYDDPEEVLNQFGDGDEIVLMRTFANWKYCTATITVNLLKCKQLKRDELEIVVIHELCHVLVNEMRENELHHEERVVTGLQKSILWVDQYARGGS